MLNPLEMERYISATANRADLQVVWENSKAPRTNNTTMYLPRINGGMGVEDYKDLKHMVAHEVRHHLYTDLATALPDSSKSLLGAIWNCIEDHRVDYLDSKKYEGDRMVSNDVHGRTCESLVKLTEVPKNKQQKEMIDTMFPLLAEVEGAYKDCYPTSHITEGLFKGVVDKSDKAKKIHDNIVSGKYTDELRKVREIEDKVEGTKATLDLACRILDNVYGGDSKKEMEEAKKEKERRDAKGDKPGEKGKDAGKGEKGNKGKDEGEGEGDDGEGSEGKDKAGRAPVVDWSLMMMSSDANNNTMQGQHLNFDNKDRDSDWSPLKASQYQITDQTKKAPEVIGGTQQHYHMEINENLREGNSSGFASKVRTILQVRAREQYHYGLKRGKLHNSALHRITMKDCSGFNERVFKRKDDKDVLNCAVSVLVDRSGSMSGDKYIHAAVSGALLNDVIGNTLHIPCEIVSFSTVPSIGCDLTIHRKHTDKRVPTSTLTSSFAAASQRMAGNPDADAVMWVFDRLVVRPEKRKLLIVLSDGSPSGGGIGDEDKHLKDVVKAIERESPVDIVGIGIMDSNVRRFYKEHHVIKNAGELEKALLSTIEGKLK